MRRAVFAALLLATPAARAESPPPAAAPTNAPAPKRFPLKWIFAGSAAVLAGVGVTFIVIEGPRFGDNPSAQYGFDEKDRLPQRYSTFLPGIVMAGAAAGLLGVAAFMHHRDTRAERAAKTIAVTPIIAPTVGGVVGVWRW